MRDRATAPTVSVIVPLYQNGRYIEQAIRSILSQTFQDFEIIVIDDGSTDDGPARVRGFVDPRIELVTKANGGISSTRNTGIALARGRYIATLDADDWWNAEKLARQVAHLDADATLDVSFTASRLVDEHGADLGLEQRPTPGPHSPRDHFCRNPVGNGSTLMIRRTALDRVGYWDEQRGKLCWFDESLRRCEDVELFLRMVVSGCRFEPLAETLSNYRIHPHGLSANIDQHLASWLAFRAKVKLFAPGLEASVGDEAEAYQRRYLARRAVRSRDKVRARKMMLTSLGLAPSMLIREPIKTSVTIAAVAAMHMLPARAHEWLEQHVLGGVVEMKRRMRALAPVPARARR